MESDMPAFYHCATFDESIAMLRDLCAQGYRIIAGRSYDEPSAPQYDRVTDQLLEQLRVGPGYCLTGEFTRFPVQLRQLDSSPASGNYIVDALTEGPVLEGLLARVRAVDGKDTTIPGFVSHQPQYRNPESGQWEKAPSDLKAAYKRAVSIMKKHLVKSELAKVPIGREVLKLAQEGKVLLRDHFGV
jgi:hypothetical protein